MYQIQTKFRNEERPRFGVLRTSEFLMKDAYSFDATLEGLNKSYDAMYAAYCGIFQRCGLDYLAVEAESGPIGGDASHEFMVLADNGEDTVLHCRDCGYAANQEKAEIGCRNLVPPDMPKQNTWQEVSTPGAATIEQVTKFPQVSPQGRCSRPDLCGRRQAGSRSWSAAITRPMRAVSTPRAAAGKDELADPKVIEQVTGAPVGFAGPVGLKQPIPIFADREIEGIVNGATGANKAETHLTGVNYGRDFQVTQFADLRNAVDGDPCPRCSSKLAVRQRDRGKYVQAGDEVFRVAIRPLPRPDGAAPADHHGLLRDRHQSHHCGLDRDLPRRQRHYLADEPGPLRGRAPRW